MEEPVESEMEIEYKSGSGSESESESESEIEIEIESESESESENDEDIVTIGEISYNNTKILGESLSTVYRGRFNNEKVAVKIIKVLDHNRETSEDHLKELESPYIVRLLHVESYDSFR